MRRYGVLGTAIAMTMAAAPGHAEDAPAPPTLAPPLAGPLTANPEPVSFELPVLGKLYVTAVGSGLIGTQSNTTPGVKSSFADISNAQVMIQKADGPLQFFVQAGVYNHETLGLPYLKTTSFTDNTYGVVPQAWIKLVPTSNFNIQVGILPSMIGVETPFSFQNYNINRGMLWGQENVLTRGVQGNLTLGKLSLSMSLTDGFFSGKYNWLTGSAAYAIDGSNTLAVVVGGALNKNYKNTFATGAVFNNSTIVNVIYTYSSGPVVITPYFQYTKINSLPLIGSGSAETWSGAILAKYTISENFSLPARVEYIDSKAKNASSPSLLYGPGSNAFSLTVTPTYTWKRFFARLEGSIVSASGITKGSAFGSTGNEKSQVRGRFEFGVMF